MIDWKAVTKDTVIRVAIYGRVSTEHEMQQQAFENQLQWYEDLLRKNPNWKVVGSVNTYTDRGITGTQAQKRPNFLRMIEDAKAGKIDMIVTREVSRFARNTMETLKYARELKEKGVEVYFVNDNIRFIQDHDGGEVKLTIMAGLAQEESRKISERVKAGQHIARKNGVLYGTGNILGYTRVRGVHDKDKIGKIGDKSVPTFIINEEEAETVRRIFELYKEGYGLTQIRIKLTQEGRKNSSGQVKWHDSTLSKMLANPMYIGKQLQHKTEVVDYLTGKIKPIPKEEHELINGDFEPIIDEETFNIVQRIKADRSKLSPKNHGGKAPTDKWTQKLMCSCGSRFKKEGRASADNKSQNTFYACRHRSIDGSTERRKQLNLDTKGACDVRSIPAWQFELMGMLVFKGIWKTHFDAVINAFDEMDEQEQKKNSNTIGIADRCEAQIRKITRQRDRLLDLYTDDKIDHDVFTSKYAAYTAAIEKQKEIISECAEEQKIDKDEAGAFLKKMQRMINVSGTQLDNETVEKFIDRVIVQSDHCFEWLVNVTGDAQTATPELFQMRGYGSDKTSTRIVNYADAAKNAIEVRDKYYAHAFAFTIPFEEAQKLRDKCGTHVRPGRWTDLLVDVYVRTTKV